MVGDFRIEEWLVQPQLNAVVRPDNGCVKLEPKVMEVLVYLADHAGEVVSKEAVFQAVWRDTFVTDDALIRCIVELRKIFGDDIRKPRVIQTIARKGYRLIGEVKKLAEAQSRHETIRKLGEAGMDERSPYPGLSSFTERDAAHFFGREAEVKALWQHLRNRRLLAVIGPSGAGKTSFVRAGVIPAAPEGWRCLWVTPGNRPFAAVARALVPELTNDAETLQRLVGAETDQDLTAALSVWRRRHGEALLVVDQFEELFTLNPREVQERFAAFIGRLASEAGVHVLISLRDDFLMRCNEQPVLAAVFTELTPLGGLTKEGLRRALEEPAKKLGYRVEDEAFIEEIVESVEPARAALPLLAFAVSRLWEQRDRERKLLTRAAYQEIGGVAGALAQHAEAVIDRIGAGQWVVREIFRNLVTAQGTRAMVDRDELLSAFSEKHVAEEVLRELIDARLVTSYEVEGREGESSHHRVEVVHESLLKAWPRLVRWQAQDEEGVVLRDQLRQAAHLWEERGRPADLLWSGTSFREYELWRGRYPGALTKLEEDFARSMAGKARRRRRLVRFAVAAAFVLITGIAIVIGTSRQQMVRARDQARAEAAQREAAHVLALGRLKVADSPNAALAYASASLELSDNDPARRFAVEALWQGPPALYLSDPVLPIPWSPWSPDGRWFALGASGGLALFERGTNERRQLRSSYEVTVGFTSDSRWLVTEDRTAVGRTVVHIWALPEGRLERTLEHPGGSAAPAFYPTAYLVDDRLITFAPERNTPWGEAPRLVRRLSLDGTIQQVLGRWEPHGLTDFDIDPTGTWILSMQRGRLLQQRLDALSTPGRVIGIHEGEQVFVVARPWRDRAVTGDSRGEVRIWNVPSARLERALKSSASATSLALDPRGRFLATSPAGEAPLRSHFLFDLAAPRTADPVPLLGSEVAFVNCLQFSPDGSWLASGHAGTVILWSMAGARSTVVGRQKPPGVMVAFTPDGHLLSSSSEGIVRRWPLSPAAGNDVRELWSHPEASFIDEVDSEGRFLVVGMWMSNEIPVVPLDGSPPRIYRLRKPEGIEPHTQSVSLDPGGRLLAVFVNAAGHPDLSAIRIVDLATGNERALDTPPKGEERCQVVGTDREGWATPIWLRDGRLVSDGDAGLRIWNLETGTSVRLRPCRRAEYGGFRLLATPDSRTILRLDPAGSQAGLSSLSAFDLVSRVTQEITSHGNKLTSFALGAPGTILVTGDKNGVVRAGPLTGEGPHLLFGHTGPVSSVAVSRDARWIASGSDDGTIRIWPMPDLSKPPLHTLPHDMLLRKLKSLTNLRAVRDSASDTGWKIEISPFPGWKDVPAW